MGRADAPLDWTPQYAVAFLTATDAAGRVLAPEHAAGTGSSAVVALRPHDDAAGRVPVVYPLTVHLRVPARYRLEPRTEPFRDVPLPPLAD